MSIQTWNSSQGVLTIDLVGARCVEWRHPKFGAVIFRHSKLDDWNGGIWMFPWCNRLKNDEEWSNYVMKSKGIKELPIHGLIKSLPFEVFEKTDRILILKSVRSSDSISRDFQFILTIEVLKSGLKWTFEVINTSEILKRISIGWHPYFNLSAFGNHPKLKCDSISNFPANPNVYSNENYIDASKPMDYCFYCGNEVQLSGSLLTLSLSSKTPLYWHVFKPNEKSIIAIEPMTSPPNAMAENLGNLLLHPDESSFLSFSMHLKM